MARVNAHRSGPCPDAEIGFEQVDERLSVVVDLLVSATSWSARISISDLAARIAECSERFLCPDSA
jgi:hypothetical protein